MISVRCKLISILIHKMSPESQNIKNESYYCVILQSLLYYTVLYYAALHEQWILLEFQAHTC